MNNTTNNAARVATTELVSSADVRPGDVVWFSGYWGKIIRIENNRIYGAWNQFSADRGGTRWSQVTYNCPEGVRDHKMTRMIDGSKFHYTVTRVFA